jgi:hypothetical protein
VKHPLRAAVAVTAIISAAGSALTADLPLRAFRQSAGMIVEGHLFGLDIWDWSMLLGGSLLVGFLALLG